MRDSLSCEASSADPRHYSCYNVLRVGRVLWSHIDPGGGHQNYCLGRTADRASDAAISPTI